MAVTNLTAGIIGLGRMGAEPSERLLGRVPAGWLPISHLEAVRDAGFDITAICDANATRTEWVKERYGLSATMRASAEELIGERAPDLLTVATRTPERPGILLRAIEKGVRALVAEKPLANNLRETYQVTDAVKASGTLLGYGAMRRAMDIYQRAKALVAEGAIGELVGINAEFGLSKLLWSLPHAVDLFLFFANTQEVDYVSGHCTWGADESFTSENYFDGDPLVETATVRFGNGVIANIVPAGGLNIRLFGSKGSIAILGDGEYLELHTPGRADWYFTEYRRYDNFAQASGTLNLYRGLHSALSGSGSFDVIDADTIRVSQQVLFAILQSSARGGSRMKLTELNEELVINGRTGANFA
ncbi:MAG: Gfo/Idh/MocA family oxidoreductase [Chitinophagaceae bacterium]|nr:MAG: Gfo/Idh/MocA family oxidoreductase [Chitinophagaceae bacterium]